MDEGLSGGLEPIPPNWGCAARLFVRLADRSGERAGRERTRRTQ
jgi:hypothetical protein